MTHPMANAIKENLPALKQSCSIEVTKDFAVHIGSCTVCKHHKYYDGEIFEIVLGNLLVRLCPDCFNQMVQKVAALK